MTGPVGQTVTMDEIGAEIEAAKAAGVDPGEVKLDGDKVPEAFRGKTLADLIKHTEVTSQALEIANKARLAAEAAGPRTVERVEVREPSKEVPKLTREALAELFEKDPIGAVAYMQDIALQDAGAQFERRFSSIAAGSASAAETTARAKYGDEFALFEKDIKQITDAMPDKSVLSSPEGWSNVVAFVRGRDGNFDKLLEHRTTKAAMAAAEAARGNEVRSAGASLTSSVRADAGSTARPTVENDTFGLDADERRVADQMDMSYKDYAYWKKVGG